MSTRPEKAKQFLEFLYNEKFDELYGLVQPNLQFKGPLFESNTAEAYVEAMRADPLTEASYTITSTVERNHMVGIRCVFTKPRIKTKMYHEFYFDNDSLIKEIRLHFDAEALRKHIP